METVKKKVVRKKAKKEDDLIECVVNRGCSWGKPGDIVEVPRHAARILQDAGALKVHL